MPTRVAELRCVMHPTFGAGVVFENRITDSGEVSDTWFVNGERLRAVLSETLVDSDKLELPVAQRKALRSAHSEYRKTHRKRVRQTANKPRIQRAFRDRIFKAEWRHIDRGGDPGLVDAVEDLAAD